MSVRWEAIIRWPIFSQQVVEFQPIDGYDSLMIRRNVSELLIAALSDTPVVFLQGPRQSGKSTLVRWLAETTHKAQYLSLDDAAVLSAADRDPQGFISGLPRRVVLDEVQRVPDLFLAIKREVDRSREPGRFLLTGSAQVLLLPSISESLAGRMEIITLWPFSQGELTAHKEAFIDRAFGSSTPPAPDAWASSSCSEASSSEPRERPAPDGIADRAGAAGRVAAGGYPEIINRKRRDRRQAWFGSYVTTILQRDVRDLARIEGLSDLPRLLALLAARTSRILNISDLSRDMAMPQTTLKRYVTLLEAAFLIRRVRPWLPDVGKRIVKSSKLMLCDPGLATYLTGYDETYLMDHPLVWGHALENFVGMEILKQCGWCRTDVNLYHYRTHGGREVDFVLQNRTGRIVGVEVKSSLPRSGASAGLTDLANTAGDRFVRGIVLYPGDAVVPLSRNMHAVPLEALWTW